MTSTPSSRRKTRYLAISSILPLLPDLVDGCSVMRATWCWRSLLIRIPFWLCGPSPIDVERHSQRENHRSKDLGLFQQFQLLRWWTMLESDFACCELWPRPFRLQSICKSSRVSSIWWHKRTAEVPSRPGSEKTLITMMLTFSDIKWDVKSPVRKFMRPRWYEKTKIIKTVTLS